MLNKLLFSAAFVVAGSAGFAQGFSGAELAIKFTNGTDVEDIGSISYSGTVEAEVGYGISVALGATAYNYETREGNMSNLTLHGIYAIDNATSFGVFIGQDYLDDESSDLFGAEIAYDFGLGDFEAYVGRVTSSTYNDMTLFGVGGTYDLGSGFSFGGTVDRVYDDGNYASTLELGGYYTLAQGPRLGVTFGQSNLDGNTDMSVNFFGLQASVAIGPNGGTAFGLRDGTTSGPKGGTTFGRRGFYEVFEIGS